MARETLPVALELMFGDEGGYSNRKTDRGGPTKYGVTHTTLAGHRGIKSVTADQVRAMSREEAEDIYRRSYWGQSGGDLLPPGLDYAAFDFGVNSGPYRAVKTLQKVLGVREDGQVGELTLAALRKYPGGVSTLIRDYCDARMRFLRSLTNGKTGFPVNGRGWTIRVTGKDPKGQWMDQPGVLGNALRLTADASGRTVEKVESPPEAGAKADSRDTGLGEVLKKPEAWGPLGGLLSAAGALFAGNGPVQWALAAAMVAAVLVGLWYFVKRVRETG
ncbi:glycoside hydrolase family 108 protein [Sinorhizobium medicae]|uniref:glycoside hydrolase family 108 protein n=1 Tax=Sinorhizobium TaxID=28105 RepID=UPI00031ABEBB|nr:MULTISPECIES: glycoside hydrolase family 108 protein [Sinorhizobium]WQO92528.1 glycoside hydrolase family 108 protein [Sinorhizobium medicae]